MIGRAVGLIDQLGFEAGPFGWTTARHVSREQRQAGARLRDDLDRAAERWEGHQGPWHVSLAGPWTLCGLIGLGSGEVLLSDAGACRDLAQAWSQAAADWCERARRLVPGAQLSFQVDEPLLPAVAAGTIGSASGLRRHRPVEPDRLTEGYAGLSAWAERIGLDQTVVHCCASGLDCSTLGQAGFSAVSLDLARLDGETSDGLAQFYQAGGVLWLGAAPTDAPQRRVGLDELLPVVLDSLEHLGVDPAQGRLWLTPACGLAGFTVEGASERAALLVRLAQAVDQSAADGRVGDRSAGRLG
jgi:hypothetical protein